jgi:serine/threonine protein kinase
LFEVLAKLLEVLQVVHEAGFAHNDAHAGNMVYSSLLDIAQNAKLIDFGFAHPFVDARGKHRTDGRGSRKLDLERLAMFLAEKFGHQVPEFVEYFVEIDALYSEEKPDYNKWIQVFRSLAQSRKKKRITVPTVTTTVDTSTENQNIPAEPVATEFRPLNTAAQMISSPPPAAAP